MTYLNHYETPIATGLMDYIKKQTIYFDVPGHKKNTNLEYLSEYYGSNIIELDTNSSHYVDTLSHPTGIIKQASELMARAYGADDAIFLVNGTTIGVQAMVMSVCGPKDKIIIPRNIHKSTVNALILSGSIPIYIQPDVDESLGIVTNVTQEVVEKAIVENPDAKAIFLLNPTYYGFTINLKSIVNLAHRYGIAVLVDEAHGAHFPFHPKLPQHAMGAGADLAVTSLHKTGGSLTQSSVLLVREGIIKKEAVQTIVNLMQTTSASYLFLSSLDLARKNLVINGETIIEQLLQYTKEGREQLKKVPNLFVYSKELRNNNSIYNYDETKFCVNVSKTGYTGFQVYEMLLNKYNIQVEIADSNNIMAVISIGDKKENIDLLTNALCDIGKNSKENNHISFRMLDLTPHVVVSPRDAFFAGKRPIKLEDAVGEISGESIMVYPPGIPIISPGEKITEEMIDYIKFVKQNNCKITDLADPNIEYINILSL